MPLDLFSVINNKQCKKDILENQKEISAGKNGFNISNVMRNRYEKQMDLLRKNISTYSMTFNGVVEIGGKNMNKIGYPTINIRCNIFNITDGFYLAQVIVNNNQYYGLAFTKKENRLAEVYIFDFNEIIYGTKVTVKILNFISILYEPTRISLYEQFNRNVQIAKKKQQYYIATGALIDG